MLWLINCFGRGSFRLVLIASCKKFVGDLGEALGSSLFVLRLIGLDWGFEFDVCLFEQEYLLPF